MTNFERLKNLDEEFFWKEIERITENGAYNCLDIPKYLKSDIDDLRVCLKYKYKALNVPSFRNIEAEKKVLERIGKDFNEEDYVRDRKRNVYVIDECTVFGEPYYIIVDDEDMMMRKVPADNIVKSEW